MARPVRGNFMTCIMYKVRHALAPDMKNLYTHQIIVRILILNWQSPLSTDHLFSVEGQEGSHFLHLLPCTEHLGCDNSFVNSQKHGVTRPVCIQKITSAHLK